MKIKVNNRTSFPFAVTKSCKAEIIEDQDNMVQIRKNSIDPGLKAVVGSLKLPPNLEPGASTLIWVTLSPDSSITNSDTISIKIRVLGRSMGAQVYHSICSSPYGALKPEQEWHSGHALHKSNWSTSIGSFDVELCKKFYGISLTINQICLTSSSHLQTYELNDDKHVEVIFENQGRTCIFGNKNFSADSKFLQGRSPFSSEDGKEKASLDDAIAPSGCYWDRSWLLDEHSIGTGAGGWVYASKWSGPWTLSCGIFSKFRRRKWLRHYELETSEKRFPKINHLINLVQLSIDGDRIQRLLSGQFDQNDLEIVLSELWFDFEKERLLNVVLEFLPNLDVKMLACRVFAKSRPSLLRIHNV